MPTAGQIRILDDQPSPQPISGVVVQIYTELGLLVTSGTTDGDGVMAFLLVDGTYNVLFYKFGVSILPRQPQQIVVDTLAVSNNFLVTGHVATLPESPDPLRCRISGYLLGADGLPTQDQRISFSPCPDISVVQSSSSLVSIQSQIEVSPDSRGYFQFDLIRGMRYRGCLLGVTSFPQLGIDPAVLEIIVPDLPALLLPNLLFPVPVLVEFSPDTISIPLASGPDGEATLGTIHYSDGSASGTETNSRTRQPPFARLDYEYSDPALFSIILSNGSTQVTPYVAGVGTVSLSRTIASALFYPNPPEFLSPPLEVTVT